MTAAHFTDIDDDRAFTKFAEFLVWRVYCNLKAEKAVLKNPSVYTIFTAIGCLTSSNGLW